MVDRGALIFKKGTAAGIYSADMGLDLEGWLTFAGFFRSCAECFPEVRGIR